MAAQTDNRPNPKIGNGPIPSKPAYPQKTNTTILEGAICVLDAGYLAPGRTATGLIVVGVSPSKSVNTGPDGAVTHAVEAGEFQFRNSAAADQIQQADVGTDCFIVDDQTVAKTSGTNTRSRAGKVMGVDANWVRVLVGLTV